jgi:O-antigen ligase
VFHALASLVYSSDFPVLEWDPRLRSVAFEPPDFANTAGYMWPWLLSAVLFSRGGKRIAFAAIWLALSGMILLSEARTSLVVIAGLIAVFLVLWFLLLPKVPRRDPDKMLAPVVIVTLIAFPLVLVLLVMYYDQLIYNVIIGDRVSNLTRLASMTAAFRMFAEQPMFGFGFGQYAFHIKEFMPSWGYYSWEIRYWLVNEAGGWPSTFSVYARFAADMGLLGLLMWVGVWLWLAWQLLTQTILYRKLTGELPFPAYPLIMSCFCVLLAGVPCDSVRSPMIWVNMGLACRYLYDIRKQMRSVTGLSQATI